MSADTPSTPPPSAKPPEYGVEGTGSFAEQKSGGHGSRSEAGQGGLGDALPQQHAKRAQDEVLTAAEKKGPIAWMARNDLTRLQAYLAAHDPRQASYFSPSTHLFRIAAELCDDGQDGKPLADIALADEKVQQVVVTIDKPGALRFARSSAVEIVRER